MHNAKLARQTDEYVIEIHSLIVLASNLALIIISIQGRRIFCVGNRCECTRVLDARLFCCESKINCARRTKDGSTPLALTRKYVTQKILKSLSACVVVRESLWSPVLDLEVGSRCCLGSTKYDLSDPHAHALTHRARSFRYIALRCNNELCFD